MNSFRDIQNPNQKEKYVKKMFGDVAKRYDLLNDILSGGLHHRWKRYAIKKTGINEGSTAIDICSGTQDMAIILAKTVTDKGHVVALDFSQEMLDIGKEKAKKKGVAGQVKPVIGNATAIEFPDDTFDAATVGFGIRSVGDLNKAISEMLRVIKPGGKAVILEFSTPPNMAWRKFYDGYSFYVLPKLGKMISSSKDGYDYLPASIRKFPKQEELKDRMEEAGFKNVDYKNLVGGIVAIHVGEK